jgi:hypothetical protein
MEALSAIPSSPLTRSESRMVTGPSSIRNVTRTASLPMRVMSVSALAE